jgi:hypothetical protein
MKKVVGVLSVVLGLSFISPAQSAEVKTIAIIDTAIDSDKNKNVVYEVCFTAKSCPNGDRRKNPVTKIWYSYQEGKGSAMVNDWKVNGVDHGHNVYQAALIANPNINIVFIRISDLNVYPTFTAMHNDGASLDYAIEWVANNASRFNISAVSISQSRSNFAAGTCPKNEKFEKSVSSLNAQNIPTFVATGNDSKKNQVGFPACVSGVVAVGALKPTVNKRPYLSSYYTEFAKYTNVGPELDVVARGDLDIISYSGYEITVTGTSVATPIAAAISVGKRTNESWNDIFASFPKSVGYPYISN